MGNRNIRKSEKIKYNMSIYIYIYILVSGLAVLMSDTWVSRILNKVGRGNND